MTFGISTNDVNIVQVIQAVAALLAALLGGAALLYSMFAYTRTLKTSNYNELDKTYLTLLQMAMQNPYLVKPDTITEPEKQEKYDLYAFMVWNFLEAIYDKCMKNTDLRETWLPILEGEGKLHFGWFSRHKNETKFKERFYRDIEALLAAASSAGRN